MASAKKIRVSQTKSSHGRLQSHKDTMHSVELDDTPEIRGMINKVSYMVKVED